MTLFFIGIFLIILVPVCLVLILQSSESRREGIASDSTSSASYDPASVDLSSQYGGFSSSPGDFGGDFSSSGDFGSSAGDCGGASSSGDFSSGAGDCGGASSSDFGGGGY
jgi:hypothetical protein